ncbi:MAG: chromosome segregation protein SMC, partial [Thermodesulfobacteriota bacterium]
SVRDEALAELAHVEERYKAVEEGVFTLEKALGEEERGAELVRMRSEELTRTCERLRGEIAEAETKKEAAVTGLKETVSAREETALQSKERQNELDLLCSDLQEVEEELQGRAGVEASLKSALVKDNAELSDIKFSLQSAIKDEAREREREAKAASSILEAKQKMLSLSEPLALLQKDIAESSLKSRSLEEALQEQSSKLGLLEEAKRGLEAEIEAAKESRAGDNARLNTLMEMEKNLENIHGGARSILKNGNLRGVHGILADFIETNPGYEKAVEAALAESLEYVIVEGQGEGLDAIGFLKTNAGGRGSFVPLREMRPAPSVVPAGLNAAAGARPLGREIKIRDGYAHIVNALLGDTIIAENLKEALEIWQGEGLFKTIVTLTGERMSPEGVITGGIGASDGGILQRRGEIKGIKKNLANLETNLGKLTDKMRGLEEELVSGRSELEELRAGLHRVEIKQVNTGSEIKRRENELSALTGLKESLEAERSEAAAALTKIAGKKKALQREREGLEDDISRNENELHCLEAEISSIEEKRYAITSAVTTAKVELARVTERREALEARRGEQERLIAELADMHRARLKEKTLAEEELEEKNRLSVRIREKIEGLYRELSSAKEGRTGEEEALSAVTGRIKEVEGSIKALEEKKRKLEEQRGTLGFGLKEIELKVASLSEKMTERYGLGLDDLPAGHEAQGEDGEEGETIEPATLRQRRDEIRAKILAMGEVSLSALEEYRELEERYNFLLTQQEDLTTSVEGLHKAIARINKTTRAMFSAAFKEINAKFTENFPKFFRGGHAELKLMDESNILESGIEIVAQPPGKKLQNLSLLSGGEKALTAVSLIFSIFLIKPSPFCLLDEVDAPLDEANIDRFNTFVRDISDVSQFILITHNKRTMEMVERLYGVTMEEPGISKVVTVKF